MNRCLARAAGVGALLLHATFAQTTREHGSISQSSREPGDAEMRVLLAQANLVTHLATSRPRLSHSLLTSWLESARDADFQRSDGSDHATSVLCTDLRAQAKKVAELFEATVTKPEYESTRSPSLGRVWRDLAATLEKLGEPAASVQGWRRKSLETRLGPPRRLALESLLGELGLPIGEAGTALEDGRVPEDERARERDRDQSLAELLLRDTAQDGSVLAQEREKLVVALLEIVNKTRIPDPRALQTSLARIVRQLVPGLVSSGGGPVMGALAELTGISTPGGTAAEDLTISVCAKNHGEKDDEVPLWGPGRCHFLALRGRTYWVRIGNGAGARNVLVHFRALQKEGTLVKGRVSVAWPRDRDAMQYVLAIDHDQGGPSHWLVRKASVKVGELRNSIGNDESELGKRLLQALGPASRDDRLTAGGAQDLALWRKQNTSSSIGLPPKSVAVWLERYVGHAPFVLSPNPTDEAGVHLVHEYAHGADADFKDGAWVLFDVKPQEPR